MAQLAQMTLLMTFDRKRAYIYMIETLADSGAISEALESFKNGHSESHITIYQTYSVRAIYELNHI